CAIDSAVARGAGFGAAGRAAGTAGAIGTGAAGAGAGGFALLPRGPGAPASALRAAVGGLAPARDGLASENRSSCGLAAFDSLATGLRSRSDSAERGSLASHAARPRQVRNE